MHKLITIAEDSDDLSIGLDRDCNRTRDELTTNKNKKGKYRLRFKNKDVFSFVEHHKKATYGLGYKLTLTRYKDETVLDKSAGVADARIKIDHIHWYVPHFTPSIQQQGILSKQILKKTHTELRFVERSVFMEEVNNQNPWNFELGGQESMNVPIWVIIRFQQRDRPDSQNLNNDTFCRLHVTSGQCIIGTEEYPQNSILKNYDDDEYSQGYGQIEEAFRVLTKDDILQPYIYIFSMQTSDLQLSGLMVSDII